MTFTVNPWWVVAVLSLALFGVVWWWQWTRDAARDARAWWRDRRDAGESGVPVSEFRRLRAWERDRGGEDEGGRIDPPWWWKPWLPRRVEVYEEEPLEGLPPERSAEALGFTGDARGYPFQKRPPTFLERLEERRERLASAAELEHRAAYEACGFDYPSGLMARVREAAS